MRHTYSFHKLAAGLILAGLSVTASASYEMHYKVKGISASVPEPQVYASCKAILDGGKSTGDGQYTIDPSGNDPFQVYCDMTTDGGGWTRVGYAKDLPYLNRWSTGADAWRWLPEGMTAANGYLELSDERIGAIRSVSSSAKQRYVGTCYNVIHHYYTHDANYGYAFGFKLHSGVTSNYAAGTYTLPIRVVTDECRANDNVKRQTVFDITHIGLPVVDVYTRDNANPGEMFGSPLTQNPAYFR